MPVTVSCVNKNMKLKVSCFNLPMKKHEGFGFNDAGPAYRFCSLGCARVSLHLD
jgi:hypothetical protein